MKKVDKVIDDPEPYVRFREMGDFSLHFTAYCWVANISDKFSTRDKVVGMIYNELNRQKIGIPFPTRTLVMTGAKTKRVKRSKI